MTLKGAFQTNILLGASIHNIIKGQILCTEMNSDIHAEVVSMHAISVEITGYQKYTHMKFCTKRPKQRPVF